MLRPRKWCVFIPITSSVISWISHIAQTLESSYQGCFLYLTCSLYQCVKKKKIFSCRFGFSYYLSRPVCFCLSNSCQNLKYRTSVWSRTVGDWFCPSVQHDRSYFSTKSCFNLQLFIRSSFLASWPPAAHRLAASGQLAPFHQCILPPRGSYSLLQFNRIWNIN